MNTLAQIEQLLLPLWNKLYKEKPKLLPESFVKLITRTIPKYKYTNFDSFFGKINKKLILKQLLEVHGDLARLESPLETLLPSLTIKIRDLNSDLILLIKKFYGEMSVKEQIESLKKHLGKREYAFVKDIGKPVEDDTHVSEVLAVKRIGKIKDFIIHNHPPAYGKIFIDQHTPSLTDLVHDFSYIINNKKPMKFVIVATNIKNKVIGYFVYAPIYRKDLRAPELKEKISYYNNHFYRPGRSQLLRELGISYTYKTRAMPGYYWDDKDKIFKEILR